MSSVWAPCLGFLNSISNILPRLCASKPCPTTKTILGQKKTFFVDVSLLRNQRLFSQVYFHPYHFVYFTSLRVANGVVLFNNGICTIGCWK